MSASGRVVVVTGATRGIGAAIARRFAEPGTTLVLGQRGDGEGLLPELHAAGAAAQSLPLDVTQPDSVDAFVERTLAEHGAIDVLVNNAGGADSAPFAAMSDEMWERMLAVNLTGTYHCMRAVIPSMFERRRGRVINIASIAGLTGFSYTAAYCAAKHGVVGLTRAVAHEASRHGDPRRKDVVESLHELGAVHPLTIGKDHGVDELVAEELRRELLPDFIALG